MARSRLGHQDTPQVLQAGASGPAPEALIEKNWKRMIEEVLTLPVMATLHTSPASLRTLLSPLVWDMLKKKKRKKKNFCVVRTCVLVFVLLPQYRGQGKGRTLNCFCLFFSYQKKKECSCKSCSFFFPSSSPCQATLLCSVTCSNVWRIAISPKPARLTQGGRRSRWHNCKGKRDKRWGLPG